MDIITKITTVRHNHAYIDATPKYTMKLYKENMPEGNPGDEATSVTHPRQLSILIPRHRRREQ
jgi:hypothetical protein